MHGQVLRISKLNSKFEGSLAKRKKDETVFLKIEKFSCNFRLTALTFTEERT